MSTSGRNARVLVTALALVCYGDSVRASAETRGVPAAFARDVDTHLGANAKRIHALAAKLHEAGLPLRPLHDKLREGLAKGIPELRIAAALEQMAENMVWIHSRLEDCVPRFASETATLLIDVAEDALASGVTRSAMQPVLGQLCGRDDPVAPLRQSVELYLYLTQRLSAECQTAWALAAQVLVRGEPNGAAHRFVATMREIHRRRGSIDSALRRALARSRDGASLHRIKNELHDQYLR